MIFIADINSLSMDELKKGIQEKKNNLSKGLKITRPKNPIDKFTNIDELLIETLRRLNVQIEEQKVTNKILVALYIQEGADGSMTAKPIAGVDTSAILEGLRGDGDYQTLNPIFRNTQISGNKEVFNIEGSGIIDVIKFVSSTSSTDNKTYGVRILCDDTILYQSTWTDFESRTPNERGMISFEDTISSEYILMFKTILYTRNFKIEVYDSSATFSLIQIKYHKKV